MSRSRLLPILMALILPLCACGSESSAEQADKPDARPADRSKGASPAGGPEIPVEPADKKPPPKNDFLVSGYTFHAYRLSDALFAKLEEKKSEKLILSIGEHAEPGVFERLCEERWIRRVSLNKPAAVTTLEPLNKLDLHQLSITELPLADQAALDLAFVAQHRNLKKLSVTRTAVTNTQALSRLTGLESLVFEECGLENIDFVRGMTRLKTLRIPEIDSPVQRYPSFSRLTSLYSLDLSGHKRLNILTLASLANVTTLKNVNLSGCVSVGSLNFLKKPRKSSFFPGEINASGCTKLNDISGLASFQRFQIVDLSGTAVSDVSVLEGKPIDKLDLSGTPVKDFGSVNRIRVQYRLYLNNTAIKDLSELKQLGRVQALQIEGTPVTDLSPLLGWPILSELYVSSSVPKAEREAFEAKHSKASVRVDQLSNDKIAIADAPAPQPQKPVNRGIPVELMQAEAAWELKSDRDIRNAPTTREGIEQRAMAQSIAVDGFFSTVLVMEWHLIGPGRSHPTYGHKGGDFSDSFFFPSLDPINVYITGRQLVTRGNLAERGKGAEMVVEAADVGFAPAQAYAALLLVTPLGPLKNDRDKAIAYAKAAAEQNNPVGDYALTVIYRGEDATPEERKQSLKHIDKLVQAKLPVGFLMQASVYEQGLDGVGQDFKKAREFYMEAAKMGQPLAFMSLAHDFATGRGGKKDLERAHVFAMLAKDRRYPGAHEVVKAIEPGLTPAQMEKTKEAFALVKDKFSAFDDKALAEQWAAQIASAQANYKQANKVATTRPSERERKK